MRKEHDVVRLIRDVSVVPAGTVGTIMMILPEDPSVSLVEFPDPEGKEIRLITVHENDLEDTPGTT